MNTRLRSVLPHLVMLIVSAGLYAMAMQIDTSQTGGGRRIGPDFWPKLVVALMAGLCLYEIVKRLLVRTDFTAGGLTQGIVLAPAQEPGAAGKSVLAAEPTPDAAAQAEPVYTGKLLAGMALVIGFVVVVPWLGFFLTTLLFLSGFVWIGGYRRPLPIVLVSLIGAVVLLVMFMRIAYISLPLGIGPFQQLSLWLLTLIGAH